MSSSRASPGRRRGRAQQRLFLAIDFGTSHIKATVGGSVGAPVATARLPVTYRRPPGGPETGLEFDSVEAWQSVCATVRRAVREAGVQISQIAGLGVTSQRLGLVILDGDCQPVYVGPNRDARAVFEGAEIDADLGEALWRATGHGPGMLLAWSKLLWLKKNRPDLYSRARYTASLADWLAHRLTGVLTMEAGLAAESSLAMVATGLPAGAFKTPLGLEEISLPPVCQAGAVIGTLKSGPAGELGLRPGTPVVACGPDTQAGLLGLGVTSPGSVGVMAGWSAAVQVVTPAPLFDDTRSMWTGRHVLPERWVLEGNAGEMGGAYDWLACLLSGGRSCTAPYDSLARLAAASPQGARGVSAYLGPSFVNISGVGLRTGGLLFPVPISFEPPDRGSLVRAAIENFAFAIRYNLDRLDLAVGGLRDIACGGGMARTKLFREVTAACAGRPVGFGIMGDATARGALSITGAATGEGLALDAAAERRRRELNVVEPGATDAGVYQDLYDSWRLRERRVLDIEL